MTLEGVDDVHSGDSLALGVFGVGNSIANDVLEEDLQHAASLFVDEARNTLDTTSAGETANSRLGDALDVVTEDFAMALGTTLSESLATLTTSRHVVVEFEKKEIKQMTNKPLTPIRSQLTAF